MLIGVVGTTLHSWGAIAPTVSDLDKIISYVRTAKPALKRWKDTKVLIIDESASYLPTQDTLTDDAQSLWLTESSSNSFTTSQ